MSNNNVKKMFLKVERMWHPNGMYTVRSFNTLVFSNLHWCPAIYRFKQIHCISSITLEWIDTA